MRTGITRTAIDEQEIRGITAKILWYIIYGTATVCVFVVASYFAIRIQITQLQDKNVQQDQRMDNMTDQGNKTDLRVDRLEGSILDIRNQLYQQKK